MQFEGLRNWSSTFYDLYQLCPLDSFTSASYGAFTLELATSHLENVPSSFGVGVWEPTHRYQDPEES